MLLRLIAVFVLVALLTWAAITPGNTSIVVVAAIGLALVLVPMVMRAVLVWSLRPQITSMEKVVRDSLVYWSRPNVEPIASLPSTSDERFETVGEELKQAGFVHGGTLRVTRMIDIQKPCEYVFDVFKHGEESVVAIVYGQDGLERDQRKPPTISLVSRTKADRFVVTDLAAGKDPKPTAPQFDRTQVAHTAGLNGAMSLHRFRCRRVLKDVLPLADWFGGAKQIFFEIWDIEIANLRAVGWLGDANPEGSMKLTELGSRRLAKGIVLTGFPAFQKRFQAQGAALRARLDRVDGRA